MRPTAGLTLLELLVVVLIVGVLATVAVVNLAPARQRALDREAIGKLQLLRQAAHGFHHESGVYPFSINQVPDLVLPRKANPGSRWAYAYIANELADHTLWPAPAALVKRPDGSLTGRFITIAAGGTTRASPTGADPRWLDDEP